MIARSALAPGKSKTQAKDKRSEGPILIKVFEFGNRPFRPSEDQCGLQNPALADWVGINRPFRPDGCQEKIPIHNLPPALAGGLKNDNISPGFSPITFSFD
jgi:hypothetical protein